MRSFPIPNRARSPRLVRAFLLAAAACVASAAVGCGDDAPGGIYSEWTSERIQTGDTIVVRTLEGSVWGDTMVLAPRVAIGALDGADAYVLGQPRAVDRDESGRIFVADPQAHQVRVYDAEGSHVRSIGRDGDGPGEFREPDDLRVGPNGEIIVRDQRGARFSVFSAEGEFLRSWPLASGFMTGSPFHVAPDGRVLNPTVVNLGVPLDEWQHGLVVFGADGVAVDTLDVPTRGYEAPFVEARTEGSWSRTSVPFTPREHWTLVSGTDFVYAVSTEYRMDRSRPDGGVLRIERIAERAPVHTGEAGAERARITRNFQNTDPAWRWRGAEIPSAKPPFREILPGADGSLWVRRHTEAHEEDNPDWDPDRPDGPPRTRWVEPVVFDVFDQEGRYMGPVRFPAGYAPFRRGVLTLEQVIVIVTHEFGHEQVVRYDVVPVGASVGEAAGIAAQQADDVEAEELDLTTRSGGAEIRRLAAGTIRAESRSGAIELELTRQLASARVAARSGRVTLRVPASFAARLDLQSRGDIRVDAPVAAVERTRDTFRGRLGEGGPTLEVRTRSGGIRVVGG